MYKVKKTYRAAAAEVVRQLAIQAGCSERTVRRFSILKNGGTNCACGETWAVYRAMKYKCKSYFAKVGICENCGD